MNGYALALFFGSIVLAYTTLKLYDNPLRKKLTATFIPRIN